MEMEKFFYKNLHLTDRFGMELTAF